MENTENKETTETTDSKKTTDSKIAFSVAQQAHLDKVISGKFKDLKIQGETLRGDAEVLRAEGETLRAENEALKQSLAKMKEADSNKGSSTKELASNLEAVAKERLDLKILSVLVTQNVVDQEAAATLLRDKIYLDNDGQAVGLDEDTGETFLDNSGKPATLDFYIKRFLVNRPYLVRSPPTMGSGFMPDRNPSFEYGGPYSEKMKRKDFDLLPTDEKLKFVRKKGEITK